jgi:N6-L-threonylcarbamoyladenine synthase
LTIEEEKEGASDLARRREQGKAVLCLGIESTAHTFGASVASSRGEILSDIREVYRPPLGSGIHPREAAQHHSKIAPKVVCEALRAAGVRPQDLDAVAYSKGPGLGPVLRVGATVARAIAANFSKPLVPIHHAIAHIEIGLLTTGLKDPLVVLVSGGHTTVAFFSKGKWRVFGETEDITLGNLLDAFGREAGIPHPAGPNIEELASKGRRLIELPYIVKGNDVSYSGLLTAAIKRISDSRLPDLCYSLQEVAFSMMVEVSERAIAQLERNELLLTGGVSANRRLREMFAKMMADRGGESRAVDPKYSGDCGAQIAWTGALAFSSGVSEPLGDSEVLPRWRFDEVEIPWRRG